MQQAKPGRLWLGATHCCVGTVEVGAGDGRAVGAGVGAVVASSYAQASKENQHSQIMAWQQPNATNGKL